MVSSHCACSSHFLCDKESDQRNLVEFVTHKYICFPACSKFRDSKLLLSQIAELKSHTDHPSANPDEFDTLLRPLTHLPVQSAAVAPVRQPPKSPGGVGKWICCAFISPVDLQRPSGEIPACEWSLYKCVLISARFLGDFFACSKKSLAVRRKDVMRFFCSYTRMRIIYSLSRAPVLTAPCAPRHHSLSDESMPRAGRYRPQRQFH